MQLPYWWPILAILWYTPKPSQETIILACTFGIILDLHAPQWCRQQLKGDIRGVRLRPWSISLVEFSMTKKRLRRSRPRNLQKCYIYICQGYTHLWHIAKKKLSKLILSFLYHEPNFVGHFKRFFLEPRVARGSNFGPSMVFLASKEVSPKIFLLWNGLLSYNTSFILKWPNYWNALHRKWKLNTVRRIKSREIM